MRPTTITAGAGGVTAWVPVDYRQNAFAIGLGCVITSGASLTYSVEHTFDSPYDLVPFYATRSTTTATATITDHQLTAGDSIKVMHAGAPFDGEYLVVSVSDANTIVYTVANSGLTVSMAGAKVNTTRAFSNAVIAAQTADKDSNYAFPIRAIRLNVTTYSSGKVSLTIIQGNP